MEQAGMDGAIGSITDEDFGQKVLQGRGPAVVDFWAQWCIPCRRLEGILQEMARRYDGRVSFFKIDVNESNATAARYAVRSLPMLLFFDGGELVDRAVGSLSRELLEEKLSRLLELT